MLNWFKPTWMVKSIYNIDPQTLKDLGIKLVLTDLDNTLIAWNHPEATENSMRWIEAVKASGLEVAIISNNSPKRVKKVAAVLGLPFIAKALKPSPRGIYRGIEKFGVDKQEILMVGDQLLTDIFAANRAGVRSALVKPLLSTDAWTTKFNRFIEILLMRRMNRKYNDMSWSDSINEPIG